MNWNSIKDSIKKLHDEGALLIIAGSFLIKFVSFFGSIFLVRLLTKTEYGVLSYYENLYGYFLVAIGFGYTNGILRYVVLEQNEQDKINCFSHSLKYGTLWNVALVLISIIFTFLYPHPSAFVDYKYILIIFVFGIAFVYFSNAGLSLMRAKFKNKDYAIIVIVTSIILILARIIGALCYGLYGTIYFRIGAEIIIGAFIIIYANKKCFDGLKAEKYSKEKSKLLSKFSAQMMITDGLWAIFMLNDLFLLGRLLGDEVLIAEYKVAYVIPANLSILVSAISIFIAPYFTKNESNKDWIKKNYFKTMVLSVGLVGFATFCCFILAKPLINLLYGREYLSVVLIMRVLLVAAFFNVAIRSVTANILSSIGLQKYNLIIALFGVILQLGADVILIKYAGVMGVAYASVGIYILMSIAVVAIMVAKYYRKNREG